VHAALGQAPASDLELAARDRTSGGSVRAYMGGYPDEVRRNYLDASPAARLPLGIPQLLVHGEDDDLIPARASRRYVDAALAGGDPARLVVCAGDGHFDHLDPHSDVWAAAVRWLETFAV
jgi:pimeloyl-ACP methyl ester carboxylesterase